MKVKIRQFLSLVVFIFFIWGCAGKRYRDMSISNPQKLISIEDSLFQSGLSKSLKQSLVFAHHNLGNQALEESEFDKAKYHFDKALFLLPQDSVLLYKSFLVKGHILYRTGNKNKLWESIQKYYSAASLQKSLGEPYYYIGLAYHKIGDKDFDLIIDSYDKALKLNLNSDLKEMVVKQRSIVVDRNRVLKDFWK